jgi:PAS domain S-box-containing protein
LTDVISHANTATLRSTPQWAWSRCLPALLVAVFTYATAEWAWWLHPGGVMVGAVAPSAGIALAALLLLPPVRWPAPLAASAIMIGAVGARHHAGSDLTIGRAIAAVAAAVATALLLRWYAGGVFRLTRLRELCTLVIGASLGGALGAAVQTLALAIARDSTAESLWRAAWSTALALAVGMVLVGTVVLTTIAGPAPGRRRGGNLEALALAVAVVVAGVFALGRWNDPLAFASVLILVWAALRFGPREVAWSALGFVVAADWAAARVTGPFTGMAGAREATTVVQAFAAITLFTALALAFALDERDTTDAARGAAVERFHRTFHDSPVAMAVTTLDGRIVETNRALGQLLAMSDERLVGSTLRALRSDDSGEHELVRPTTSVTDGYETPEVRLLDERGGTVWVEISESPLRRLDGPSELQVVVLRNVTERKTLQQQLFHAQKMESVGRLAGGIAHDFNNVLAVMRGQVELLQDDFEVLESARARIDSVQRATDRAAALTDDLMAYSRQRIDEPVPFDLHELIRGVRELLHQVLGVGVTLELQLDATPATIVADPNRIEQAVLNLIVNARDAMPAGGRVTIATRTEPAPSHALVLSVADTGAGMDIATRARIFEPFFTTKPPGFGTGLGLSTTDDIVRAAGGVIEVDSQRGRGTTFALTFPGADERPPSSDLIDLSDEPEDAPTVLVVDDESDVRALIAEILRGSGYRVVAAPDGDAAIALLERATRPVDLLVTDVVMPVMSGTDLAARVTSRSPATRVLFVSGFVPAGSAALRGAPLVAKPLRRAELLDAVQTALHGAA